MNSWMSEKRLTESVSLWTDVCVSPRATKFSLSPYTTKISMAYFVKCDKIFFSKQATPATYWFE